MLKRTEIGNLRQVRVEIQVQHAQVLHSPQLSKRCLGGQQTVTAQVQVRQPAYPLQRLRKLAELIVTQRQAAQLAELTQKRAQPGMGHYAVHDHSPDMAEIGVYQR